MISDFLGEIPEPLIYCDSQSALSLSKNPLYHDCTKHIDINIKSHYLRW